MITHGGPGLSQVLKNVVQISLMDFPVVVVVVVVVVIVVVLKVLEVLEIFDISSELKVS